MGTPLFSEYLNAGSSGLAVNVVICLFAGSIYDDWNRLRADGQYGEELKRLLAAFRKQMAWRLTVILAQIPGPRSKQCLALM